MVTVNGRLEKDGHGELLYQVHLDILQRYIKLTDNVLEIGAGSGRYTKDMVAMCTEMRSTEMDALFAQFPVRVQERSSAGLYTQAGDAALENARNDKEFWKQLVEMEIAFTKLQGTLDFGMNVIYVVQKL